MGLKIEEKVEEAINDQVISLGFEIEYVEFVKEADQHILRVVIDKQNEVVSIDDCEKISRAIEEIIDNIVTNEYILEVSSPGVERQLKNIKLYTKYIGKEIYVKLYKKIDDIKELTSVLFEVDNKNESITLKSNEHNINIMIKDISSAHTVYDFSAVLKGNKNVNMNKLNKF